MASKVYRMTQARKQAIEQYSKQYSRIRRYVSSLTKKGYKVPEGIVPAKPASAEVKGLSTAQLKKRTKEAEYLKSYRILHKSSIEVKTSKTIEVVSGEEYREIVRTKRREEREYKRTHPSEEDERERRQQQEEEKQFKDQQRKRDEEARKRAKKDVEYKQRFSKAEIAYNTVQQMIDDVRNSSERGYLHTKAIWNEEIHSYGRDKVLANIVNMEANYDLIYTAERAIHYSEGSRQHSEAINALLTIIRGYIPSADEIKTVEEEIESEAYTEEDYY